MRLEVEVSFALSNESQIITEYDHPNNSAGNNVTNKAYILTGENYNYRGKRGFQFADKEGEWPAIADGSYQYFPDEGYRGFMSKALSDSEGFFEKPVQIGIAIKGKAPSYLFIQFDRVINLYATVIRISNNHNVSILTVNNKRALCYVDLSSLDLNNVVTDKTNNLILTLEFISVNKSYQSLRLTQISLTFKNNYTENELISCENSEQLFNSQMQISPGIVEQYADIQMYDRTGILHELAKKELLSSRQDVIVKVYDDENNEIILGIYRTDDWEVLADSNEVTVTCTDMTEQLDKRWADMSEIADRSVHDLLARAFKIAGVTTWQYIDEDTEEYCKSIVTPNSWYYGSTIKELLNKICQLGQICIYTYLGSYIIARCY